VVNPDGNANGVVDAADYVLWRKKLSAAPTAVAATGAESPVGWFAQLQRVLANAVITPQEGSTADISQLAAASGQVAMRRSRSDAIIPRRSAFLVSHDIALLAVLNDGERAEVSAPESALASAVTDSEDDLTSSIDEVFAGMTS
jgi:hypothetical protein